MYKEDTKILKELKLGNRDLLGRLYLEHRDAFLAFSKKFPLDETDRLDAWQDALVVLYDNICSGRLIELKSSLKTYLFSIGKYILLAELRRRDKVFLAAETEGELLSELVFPDEGKDEDEYMQLALKDLGESCRELLTYYYYENFSIEAIAIRMGYANENTVSAQKSRCLKKLKALLLKKTSLDG